MKKKPSRFKALRCTLLIVFTLCLCGAGAVTAHGYAMYSQALAALPTAQAAENVRSQEGFTSLEGLPETYLQAVVATEDHRFYQHNGIDILAIGRALVRDIVSLSLEEGGSTITQQLAKNLYFTQEKALSRKVAEVFMAWRLEADFTKDQLLELYVNSIYFGSGCYTVGDACREYFNCDPAAMTDFQATLLAGIPNAPSVYDLNENPDLARQRQRQVVALMVEHCQNLDQEWADGILTQSILEESGVALCAGN